MRLNLVVAIAAAAVLSGCAGSMMQTRAEAPAQDPRILAASQSVPEAFVIALFANYADGSTEFATANQTFYSRRTMALMAANTPPSTAPVGDSDWDPICNCESWSHLTLGPIEVAAGRNDRNHANLLVHITNDGETQDRIFVLVRESDGWRIDDIRGPSLLDSLRAGHAPGYQ